MISSQRVPEVLCEAFPELTPNLKSDAVKNKLHQQLNCFAAFTKTCIEKHDEAGLQKCFQVADCLCCEGDQNLQEAIETSYLHVLHLDSNPYLMRHVRPLLPPNLMRYERHLEYNQLP